MIDYTKAAVNKIIADFKSFFNIFQIGTYIVSILYLIYALITQSGILLLNLILLGATAAYLSFFVWYVQSEKKNKQLKEKVKTSFVWVKRIVKIFNIGVALYGVYNTAKKVTVLSVVLSAFMIIGFVLDILFEIVIKFFINKAQFVYEAMQADFDNFKKPVTAVGNFFKRIKGEEIEEREPTKNRELLDELVASVKEEKKRLKEEKKQRKKEKRRKEKNDGESRSL